MRTPDGDEVSKLNELKIDVGALIATAHYKLPTQENLNVYDEKVKALTELGLTYWAKQQTFGKKYGVC